MNGLKMKLSRTILMNLNLNKVILIRILEFKDLFDTHKMMKHKYYDKYYVGNWNHEGYPEGKGVLLVPDTFLYSGDFKKTP